MRGGCGAVKGTILRRGLPEDFDNWATWVNPDWSYATAIMIAECVADWLC
jgi:choline dehydrogenase-like flavoprotein